MHVKRRRTSSTIQEYPILYHWRWSRARLCQGLQHRMERITHWLLLPTLSVEGTASICVIERWVIPFRSVKDTCWMLRFATPSAASCTRFELATDNSVRCALDLQNILFSHGRTAAKPDKLPTAATYTKYRGHMAKENQAQPRDFIKAHFLQSVKIATAVIDVAKTKLIRRQN